MANSQSNSNPAAVNPLQAELDALKAQLAEVEATKETAVAEAVAKAVAAIPVPQGATHSKPVKVDKTITGNMRTDY